MLKSLITYLFWILVIPMTAQTTVSVALDGSADFTSIQKAIESLPNDNEPKTVLIKPGVYREKVFLDKNNIRLVGQKKPQKRLWWKEVAPKLKKKADAVYIIVAESRDIWRCSNNDDWGAAAINIRANDIAIENIVAANTFGFDLKEEFDFDCKGELKKIRKDGHQFALRSMPPTQRLTVTNSNFYSLGGDTVSPWDVENGTYYFKSCTMEGGVDCYCPRGWAVAENCFFICHNKNAAIWHDGTGNEDAKSVILNGEFVGEPGYKLGRYHRDAQIFLINNKFSKEMADSEVYQVATTNELAWGKRIYYFGNKKAGSAYAWYQDNIDKTTALAQTKQNVLNYAWNNPKPYVKRPEVQNGQKQVAVLKDSIAEHMLIAQRVYGGWPKTLDGKTQPPNYSDHWSDSFTASVLEDKNRNDGTIDNGATTREINYLLKAYRTTKNPDYLQSLKNGLSYLVVMQYDHGGFPQFFPDTSGYRNQITYNDDAMINALQVFRTFTDTSNLDMDLGNELVDAMHEGTKKGIDCILRTQIEKEGIKTIWAAQYDPESLKPAKARIYEHPSFATKESVAIVDFLMGIQQPSDDVRNAIRSAVRFLDKIKLKAITYKRIKDPASETGYEVALGEDKFAKPLWARFYDLELEKPIFSGRDGIKRFDIFEIEVERRTHYGWYGYWPEDLLEKEYPRWHERNIGRSQIGITGVRDTSYNLKAAYESVIKKEKNATLPKVSYKSIDIAKDVVYATKNGKDLHIDVVRMKGTQEDRTALVMLHGGGWRTGDKTMHTDLAAALAKKGYVVFLVEYRLSTEALYPAPIEDIRDALRYIVRESQTYKIKGNDLVLMGFSAGGQLSALVASTMKEKKFGGQNISYKDLPHVKAFIDMDGITAYIHPDSGEGIDGKKLSAATYWFGAPVSERPDLYHDASAPDRVEAPMPMALFIASGEKRMQAGWEEYRQKLNDAGVYNDYLKFENAPHSFVFFEPWFTPMVEKIDTFLKNIQQK